MPSAAAGSSSHSDRLPVGMPMPSQSTAERGQVFPVISEAFAKDAIIAWFRGEFAAANAIIDALCGHLTQHVDGGNGGAGSEYEAVFAAIHRRRLNWIPILQMQKYYPIADVALELQKVAEKKAIGGRNEEARVSVELMDDVMAVSDQKNEGAAGEDCGETLRGKSAECYGNAVINDSETEHSHHNQIADAGSQLHSMKGSIRLCSNHEDCAARTTHIKLTKGYVAKESVKGHTVNALKGLKLFEDAFTRPEISKLSDFANELRFAGQNGELSGETFILFNKQMKGNKRELIQLGVPIFGQIRDGEASLHQSSNIEPIPALLNSVIDHFLLWQLIPDYKRPNSCIINFYDEGEYSQPFLKPPHLEQLIITLVLSESTMTFGRTLTSDKEGNLKGPLMLSLNEGSVIIMRGNSADMARHVMCASPTRRISVTFFRVRQEGNKSQLSLPPLTGAMTLWRQPPGSSNSYRCGPPVVMVAPMGPMMVSPRQVANGGGTGVFLPWTVGSRKQTKHLPPRAQKGRLLALPSPVEDRVEEAVSDSGIAV